MEHQRVVWAERHRQYQRYVIAGWDLRIADLLAETALGRGLFDNGGNTTTPDVMAYSAAIVVTYARPFIKAKGHVGIDGVLKVFSAEQMALHERLRSMRMEIFAHTDKKHFMASPDISDGTIQEFASIPCELLWGLKRSDVAGVRGLIATLNDELVRRKKAFEDDLMT